MNVRPPDRFETPTTLETVGERVRGMRPAVRIAALIALVLIVGLIVWSLFGPTPAPKAPPPPPVVVQKVVRVDLPVVEHTIGTVVSNAMVQVTARVQGQLLRAYFVEGQTVRAGQLLFQIDPRPYQAAYASAAALVTSTKAKAARYAALAAQNAIAQQQSDDARAAYLQAASDLETARLNLQYTQIRSPIDGKTGPILIQPGNQIMASGGSVIGVNAPATATTSSALVTITQMTPIKISFALPQTELPAIQKRVASGMSVSLTEQNNPQIAPMTAKVDFVGNAVNGQTGTIELRATFANAGGELVPGQLVNVAVVLDMLRNVMAVPHDAVNLGPANNFVYVVRDGKAQMVTVNVVHDDGTTAAIEGNIRAGDAVITDGQLRVIAGKPVSIVKHAMPRTATR